MEDMNNIRFILRLVGCILGYLKHTFAGIPPRPLSQISSLGNLKRNAFAKQYSVSNTFLTTCSGRNSTKSQEANEIPLKRIRKIYYFSSASFSSSVDSVRSWAFAFDMLMRFLRMRVSQLFKHSRSPNMLQKLCYRPRNQHRLKQTVQLRY